MKQKLLAFAIFCCGLAAPAFTQCDLELSATVSNPTPPIWTNVDYVLTLSNKGPQTATQITVFAPQNSLLSQSYGLVFTDAVATKGSWNIFGQAWTLPALAPNETATLTLTLFTMKNTLPVFYAAVQDASPSDVDSSPGNNPGPTPTEDDEAVVADNTASCDLAIEFADVSCGKLDPNSPDGRDVMKFRVKATTADPTAEFAVISQDPSFVSKWTIPVNEPFGPPFLDIFFFDPEFVPNQKFYAKLVNNPTCLAENTLEPLPGCGTPFVPGNCILQFFGPSQVFCKNNGAHFGFALNFSSLFNFGAQGVSPSDIFQVFMDGSPTGVFGSMNEPFFFGLNQDFPIPASPAVFALIRNGDQACISEFVLNPADFCNDAPFVFCGQQAVFPWHEWIKRVQFDGIDKSSGKSQVSSFQTGPFQQGTQAAFVNAGDDVPVTITAGYSFVGYDEYVRIWIDANRNGAFDLDEQVFEGIVPAPVSGANVQSALSGLVHIPENAHQGLTTMKITMNRGSYASTCGTVPFGEVEYYSVNILGGVGEPDPCAPISLTMLGTECTDFGTPDQASDDGYYIEYRLDFPGRAGESIFPTVYKNDPCCPQNFVQTFVSGFEFQGTIGQDSRFGPIPMADFPQVNFVLSVSTPNAQCFAPLTVVNAPAPCSDGQPPAPGENCAVSSDYPWEDWVSKVKISGFEKTSGKSQYSDFTASVINLNKNTPTPLTLTTSFSYFTHDEYWRIWIDYDHDGLFETPSEVAFEGILTKPAPGTPSKNLTGTLTVPATALTGPTHARVMMRRSGYGAPCGTIPFGEIEDYTVNISQGLLAGEVRADGNWKPGMQKLDDFTLFPNPAGESVFVKVPKISGEANLLILNQLGTVAKDFSTLERFSNQENGLLEMDLSDLPNGQYFLLLEIPGERNVVKKLTVMRGY